MKHVRTTLIAAAAVTTVAGFAQMGRTTGADWGAGQMTPQRTSWVQSDPLINPESMTGTEFKLQWTWKPTGAPHSTTVAGLTMQTGLAKPISMVAFGPTYFAAVDNDTGDEYWTKHISATQASAACESASAISRPNDSEIRPRPAPRQMASPGPFVSAVGAPGEGAPEELMRGGMFGPSAEYIAEAAAARAAGKPLPPAPPSNNPFGGPPPASADAARPSNSGAAGTPGLQMAGPGAGSRPAAGQAAPGAAAPAPRPMRFNTPQGFYAVTPDGVLHTFGQNTAKDIVKPKPFLPAGSKVTDLIMVNNMAYATTSGNCGGAQPGIYAIGTEESDSGEAVSIKTGADVLGGPAFTVDGNMFAVVGAGNSQYANSVVALDPKTLAVKSSFKLPEGAGSGAIIVKVGEKELVAAAGKDGRVYLLDPMALGGTDHKTPLATSDGSGNKKPGAAQFVLTSWIGAGGDTWIEEPGATGLRTLKVTGSADHPEFASGWSSGDLNSSVPPIVVTGVLFGVDPAKTTLIAMDASSGKKLWESGKTIKAAVNSQPWYSLGQVYVAAADGTVYAFGFPMDRY